MDIHLINNLKVLNYPRGSMVQPEGKVADYVCHWIHEGLLAFQQKARKDRILTFGAAVGLADICLVRQMVNARRSRFDLTPFEHLCEIGAPGPYKSLNCGSDAREPTRSRMMRGRRQTREFRIPLKKSWVDSAISTATDFPLNNLPYGVFSTGNGPCRLAVAIGDAILDVSALAEAQLPSMAHVLTDQRGWIGLMEAGPESRARFREAINAMLGEDYGDASSLKEHLIQMSQAKLTMPFAVSEYTDFYAGKHHPHNVGTMFRGPENALPSNWLHIPIGYLLLNGWSARDIQAWEYQPLGPFQSKATAKTTSPWVVTKAALEPFRCAAPEREVELGWKEPDRVARGYSTKLSGRRRSDCASRRGDR